MHIFIYNDLWHYSLYVPVCIAFLVMDESVILACFVIILLYICTWKWNKRDKCLKKNKNYDLFLNYCVGYSSILFKPSKGECIQNIPSTPRLTKHELLLVTKISPKTDSVKLPGLFKPSKGECIQNIHSHPPFLNVNFSKWQKLHLKLVKLNRLSTWFL